jgi:hypothetical protein
VSDVSLARPAAALAATVCLTLSAGCGDGSRAGDPAATDQGPHTVQGSVPGPMVVPDPGDTSTSPRREATPTVPSGTSAPPGSSLAPPGGGSSP